MFALANWDDGLTEAQREVATHADAPLVVVAGAGTGKTRALIARLAHLLESGVPAERILLLSFTRRAADDMLGRANALSGRDSGRLVTGGTFHSVAYRVLSSRPEVVGLSPGFGVIDPGELVDLLDLMRADHGLAGVTERFPRPSTLASIYSRCVNRSEALNVVVPTEFPWCAGHLEAMADLFRSLTTRKREMNIVDFDDLLLYWRAQLEASEQRSFDYVLVDEYQDVNQIQVDIVRALAPDGRGLTVVGDEAQAIYGFRGADSRHLREMITLLPEARVICLEENFRSLQGVLDVANATRPAEGGPSITLRATRGPGPTPRLVHSHDAPGEARAIVEDILRAHEEGVDLREQAILVRAGHHSDLIEVELAARHVPYRKYGGLRFLEAAHVRDFVAAARIVDNARDEVAWYRVLRLHPNIGAARARGLLETVRAQDHDPLSQWANIVSVAPSTVREGLADTLNALASAREHVLADARAGVVLDALRPLLRGHYPDASARLGDLERLASAATGSARLSDWLAEITLDPPNSTSDLAGPPELDEDYVVISTIHSAKGLEWSRVHVPHVIDGVIPIDMALGSPEGLAEERRLFYVAITRARDELSLYAPMRLAHHRRALDDRHSYALLSRFVDDVVRSGLLVEEAPPVREAPSAPARPVVVDLDRLWVSGS